MAGSIVLDVSRKGECPSLHHRKEGGHQAKGADGIHSPDRQRIANLLTYSYLRL